MKDLFKLEENKTTASKEILAGLTTFLAMAYILAVNPAILSTTGMPSGGVFIATALSGFIGTVFMAVFANYPFALAPSMGLNAYFAYTVVQGMGYSWQYALLAVFIEGLIFLLLSVTKVRESLFNCIPLTLKTAISVGIGLFIAFIALQNAYIIIDSPTLVSFQSFSRENIHTHGLCAILALIGTLFTAWFVHKGIRGGILLGILLTWGLGIISELVGLYVIAPELQCFSLKPKLSLGTFTQSFSEFSTLFGALFKPSDWTLRDSPLTGFELLNSANFFIIILAFMFVDIFDTMGTLIGVSSKAEMLDKDGRLPRIRGALFSDSLATSVGAVLGTSTVTTFVESASGVAAGGRTGLTALSTALLFLLSILLAPLFLEIPGFATAPALIIVGFYMISSITKIKFDNYLEAIPAYLTILFMPFSYSISEGISIGVISWTVLNFFSPNRKNINPLMYVLTLLFLSKYVLL
ncbi:MAG: NCS2 family permease [Victivallales bacterium]|nr:NCS2 family permease [Victivallales bacterium]